MRFQVKATEPDEAVGYFKHATAITVKGALKEKYPEAGIIVCGMRHGKISSCTKQLAITG